MILNYELTLHLQLCFKIITKRFSVKCNSFTARRTPVLILSSLGIPVITDMGRTVKYGGTDFEFEFETDTQVYYSCSINWQGDLYLFGGQTEKRQVSRVEGCQLTRVATLPFDLHAGACTNVNNEELFLCFDRNNDKKCWKSLNPEGPFSSISDSLKNHWPTRIANDQG